MAEIYFGSSLATASKSYLLFTKIMVELDRIKNFESVAIRFSVSDGFRISEKVSDSIGFGIRHVPN